MWAIIGALLLFGCASHQAFQPAYPPGLSLYGKEATGPQYPAGKPKPAAKGK